MENKNNSRVVRRRRLKKFMIASLVFTLISLISIGIFSYSLLSLNIIPMKYLAIIFDVIAIIYLLLFIIFFKKKCPKALKIFAYIFSVVLSLLLFKVVNYLNSTNNFFDKIQIKDYDTITYSVLTLKENKYKIDDLNNKTLGLIDDKDKEQVISKLKSKIKFEEESSQESMSLATKLLDNEIDGLCLEQGYISMLNDELENFNEKTEVIYSFKIKVKAHNQTKKIDATKNSFIVYISGIDQYGNVNSIRGRSDVNQLAIVNPNTHKVLLLNTPRDYYVQLADTTGLKDKLTHAGIYGIDKSINTLQNLYNIDINYYFRVNFNSLINIVDAVGGIDIDSDTAFTAWTNPNVYVRKGINHFNGEQALAYARERHAYSSGDRHRGENQQQIIKAIITKAASSKFLLENYNQLLDALGGAFQTNMPSDTMTKFIKEQMDDLSNWEIDNYSVDGTGSSQPTYSMGSNIKLSVMIPNEDTIKVAQQKINEVLEGK